ncbi:hypothetical protein [Mycobacterium numidiamassiliense]|uniref:hypothetical protein n=1 Tax=Mycobacterium numidiamassiliense TaxID=1841861 RepID=UPI0009F88465|nr:hypothetical protein [Mycobacterium numidiamassiliense]
MATSIVLLVLAVVGCAVAGGMEFMLLAFTDYCPAPRCNADRAATFVMVSVAAAAALTLVGSVLTIVWLLRRRSAWPLATATLVLSVVAELVGAVGYFAAVGH